MERRKCTLGLCIGYELLLFWIIAWILDAVSNDVEKDKTSSIKAWFLFIAFSYNFLLGFSSLLLLKKKKKMIPIIGYQKRNPGDKDSKYVKQSSSTKIYYPRVKRRKFKLKLF